MDATTTANGTASAPPPSQVPTSSQTPPSSSDASPFLDASTETKEPQLPPFLAKIRASLPTASAPAASPDTPPIHGALYLPPPAQPDVQEDLVPPENFAAVTQGVYRCGFPKKRNFKFLETLQLKTVLLSLDAARSATLTQSTLVLEDYPDANLEWCQDQDIQFLQFGIPGNKEPFDNIPEDVICSALVTILDKRNHPLLIHCNKGKHRTGCLVGCIRRLQSWSLTSIFDEYRRFSAPKSRAVDQQFIDLFDLAPVWSEVVSEGGGLANLPNWRMLALPLSLATQKHAIESKARERGEREAEDSATDSTWRDSRPGREGRMSIGGANLETLDSPPVVDVGLEVVAQ